MKFIHSSALRTFLMIFFCFTLLGILPGCTADAAESAPDTGSSIYQAEILRLVNEQRAAHNLPALSSSSQLTQAAQQRATELSQRMDANHLRPDGRSFYTVLDDFGISYTKAAENIARGQQTPAEVVRDWMNSEGHRKNILSSEYDFIGIGIYIDSSGMTYWTQEFIG